MKNEYITENMFIMKKVLLLKKFFENWVLF